MDINKIRTSLGLIRERCPLDDVGKPVFIFSRRHRIPPAGVWNQVFNEKVWPADSWLVNWGCLLSFVQLVDFNWGEQSLVPEGFLVFGNGVNGDLLGVQIETGKVGWLPIDFRKDFCPTDFTFEDYLTAAYDNDLKTPRDYWSAIKARDAETG